MKKMLILISLLGLALSSVQAQSMRDYDRGIIFSFSGLSFLGADSYVLGRPNNSPAYGIGFKKYLSDGIMSVRPGLILSRTTTEDDPANNNSVGEKTTTTAFGFSVDVLKDLRQGKITPFIGAGIGYIKDKSETKEAHLKGASIDSDKTTTSSFLIRGILGVEYFVAKNVSLSGEYQMCYAKTTETYSKSETKTKLSELDIASNGVLNLTIYLP